MVNITIRTLNITGLFMFVSILGFMLYSAHAKEPTKEEIELINRYLSDLSLSLDVAPVVETNCNYNVEVSRRGFLYVANASTMQYKSKDCASIRNAIRLASKLHMTEYVDVYYYIKYVTISIEDGHHVVRITDASTGN